MAWWGRLVGGTFGYAIGGPIGAIIGVVVGGHFDKSKKRMLQESFTSSDENEERQTIFFTSIFVLLGHISKIDGHVSRDEIEHAEAVMRSMSLAPEQRELAIEFFQQGKRRDFDPDPVIHQFRKACGRRKNIRQVFLQILIAGAISDGQIDQVELDELQRFSDLLDFSRQEFNDVLDAVMAEFKVSSTKVRSSLADDYKVLGVRQGASLNEVKRAYRRKMSQLHPDKLVSKGLPEEMIEMATEKTAQIRASYERVRDKLKVQAST